MIKNLQTIVLILSFAQIINAQNSWVQKADMAGGFRYEAMCFTIGTKAYIGTGRDENLAFHSDFWEWDQATDTWTQIASLPDAARMNAVGFSIGTKGYLATGFDKHLWEWDQATNTWTQKANYPGGGDQNGIAFSMGTKGYAGTGYSISTGLYYNDFWEWDQATNIWTQLANFGGSQRYCAVGFAIGTKGYVGTGSNGNWWGDFWEWDQTANSWTQKANFPPGIRNLATGFSIGNKGYIGTGLLQNYNDINDFYEWDQATNVWTQKANVGTEVREQDVGFSIGDKGYIAMGYDGYGRKDLWEYTPCNALLNPVIAAGGPTTFCQGDSVILTCDTATYYSWSNGGTSRSIKVLTSGTYSVSINFNGCLATSTASMSVTVNPTYYYPITDTICQGNSYTFPDGSIITAATDTIQTSHFSTINMCDSNYITALIVHPAYNFNYSASICHGDTFTFPDGGTSMVDSIHTSHFSTIHYCDSNIITTLIVFPTYQQYVSASICQGDTFTFPDGVTSMNDTLDTSHLISSHNCDSTIVTVLIVHPLPVPVITADGSLVFCQGDSVHLSSDVGVHYLWNNGDTTQTITADTSGNYSVILTDINNCVGTSTNTTVLVHSLPPVPIITFNGNLLVSSTAFGNQWLLNNSPMTGATDYYFLAPSTGCYSVMVTDSNGCTNVSDTVCVLFNGIEELNVNNGISLYPNPNNGTSTLIYNIPQNTNADFIITDMLGRILYSYTISNIEGKETLNLDLNNGIYFWKIRTDKGVIDKGKMVINNN